MVNSSSSKLHQEKGKTHHHQKLQDRESAEHQGGHMERHRPRGVLEVYGGLCVIHGGKDRKKNPQGTHFSQKKAIFLPKVPFFRENPPFSPLNTAKKAFWMHFIYPFYKLLCKLRRRAPKAFSSLEIL